MAVTQDGNTNSNAIRFINAYNSIDYSLRSIHNMKRSISFADAVRRCAALNSVVRKYEDKLIDYGRLRNSIVHGGAGEIVIAEPHDDVTKDIEKIAELISTPPLAYTIAKKDNIVGVLWSDKIKNVMKTIYNTGFKNLPIYKNETIIGVANLLHIASVMSRILAEDKNVVEFINNTPIENILEDVDDDTPFYLIKSEQLTIEETISLFQSNRRLYCILITKNGNYLEKPTGILTQADIIDLNNILDNY